LTQALLDPELELRWRVIAHRYLDDYALADKDLLQVIRFDPSNVLALNQLGLLAEDVKKDDNLAVSFYRRAADLKYAVCIVNLAALYREGRGVPKNSVLAFKLLASAAEAGYSSAYSPLGVMYAKGEGTLLIQRKHLPTL